MPTLHLLGTGAAVSEPHRTTTMLAFSSALETVIVDCGGDVVQRFLEAGLDLDRLSALIISHEHPDHVSGFPLFMEKIWLAGRRRPIPVYGIEPALEQARRCFETFDTSGWEGMPEIVWHQVPLKDEATVLETESWTILSSPGKHAVPVVGLRVASKESNGIVAYSCDTEPFEPIERLSIDSDILVHEATGEGPGHSSAEQAAEVAARAGASRLLLVHLPPLLATEHLEAARRHFANTDWGKEGGRYSF